jgi:sporulation protein YlmC with PRC-barrel domain
VVSLSKLQKEKSLTKDKLLGMKVIDSDGKLVGTVKDVGFTVGKAGISLTVEDSDGETVDISWESIQGAADFVVLKPVAQTATQTMSTAQPVMQPAVQTAQPVQQNKPLCPTCNQPLTYIQQYQRWYCYNEKKYV